MFSSRNSIRASLLAAGLLACFAVSAQTPEKITTAWIAEYLEKYSEVLDAGDGHGSEILATRLTTGAQQKSPSLVYERTVYDSDRDRTPTSKQLIHYPCNFAQLDPETLKVMPWEGQRSGTEFWVVTIRTLPGTEPLEYTNVVEDRHPDGRVEITSSRSRVTTLALGYFKSEGNARHLSDSVALLIADLSESSD